MELEYPCPPPPCFRWIFGINMVSPLLGPDTILHLMTDLPKLVTTHFVLLQNSCARLRFCNNSNGRPTFKVIKSTKKPVIFNAFKNFQIYIFKAVFSQCFFFFSIHCISCAFWSLFLAIIHTMFILATVKPPWLFGGKEGNSCHWAKALLAT